MGMICTLPLDISCPIVYVDTEESDTVVHSAPVYKWEKCDRDLIQGRAGCGGVLGISDALQYQEDQSGGNNDDGYGVDDEQLWQGRAGQTVPESE